MKRRERRESLKNMMTKRMINSRFQRKLRKRNQVKSRMKKGKTLMMMKKTTDFRLFI